MKKFWRPGRADLRTPREDQAAEDEPPAEDFLRQLSSDVADGKRAEVVASEGFWMALRRLQQENGERSGLPWLRRFALLESVSVDARAQVQTRLADDLLAVGELADAAVVLQELVAHGEASRLLPLAQTLEKLGHWQRAADAYEQLIAIDIDAPNARARLTHLRRMLGAPTAGQLNAVTMAAPQAKAAGDRYQLVRELGRGGAGVVYQATDLEVGRQVAIKLIHAHMTRQSSQVEQFFAEARTAASLRHPNIVAVFDIVTSSYALVMELAEGGTLKQRLAHGKLVQRSALERFAQLMSALVAAHRQGIAHRDVKPSNLLYRRAPRRVGSEIMLGDFGVAQLMQSETSTEGAVGTLGYMAPEQRRGESGGAPADVYAAGLVLAEMLAGELPQSWRLAPPTGPLIETLVAEAGVTGELASHTVSLLSEVLHEESAARPTTEAILAKARFLRDLAMVASGASAVDKL